MPVEPTLATFETPDFAARTHAPHMEGWAYNQMPKAGWSDLKLFQYDGTDLYQWFGKKTGSVFEDAEGEPFAIKPAAPAPSSLAGGEVVRDLMVKIGTIVANHGTNADNDAWIQVMRFILAALSPEAPARPMWMGIDAAEDAPQEFKDFAADFNRRQATLTPRHEAPAEGAGEDHFVGPLECLQEIAEARWSGDNALERIQDFAARELAEALRARSSAPEARDAS